MELKKEKATCDMCELEKECNVIEGVGYRVWICDDCLYDVDIMKEESNEKEEANKIYVECPCCGGMKLHSYTYHAKDGWHAAKHCDECCYYENTNEKGEVVYDHRLENKE